MTILFILLFALLVGLIVWGVDGRLRVGAVAFGLAGIVALIFSFVLDIFI